MIKSHRNFGYKLHFFAIALGCAIIIIGLIEEASLWDKILPVSMLAIFSFLFGVVSGEEDTHRVNISNMAKEFFSQQEIEAAKKFPTAYLHTQELTFHLANGQFIRVERRCDSTVGQVDSSDK